METRIGPLIRGLATFVPGLRRFACGGTGGTDSARYCYSVWLRHLVKAAEAGLPTRFRRVAELGPGDSLGIGIAAVLCGVDQYYALDVKRHASPDANLRALDELVALFRRRAPIPGPEEFPAINPPLASYEFPHEILGAERLEASLAEPRLARIRAELQSPAPGGRDAIAIVYAAPWDADEVVEPGSADLIFSQAVLEHVEGLDHCYRSLRRWIAQDGFMSHTIDFRSHGTTRRWNGHWTLAEWQWRALRGRRSYLINRQPRSVHIEALADAGFEIVSELVREDTPLARSDLRPRFRALSDADLRASGTFLQVRPVEEAAVRTEDAVGANIGTPWRPDGEGL